MYTAMGLPVHGANGSAACASRARAVDFWWVKPSASEPGALEERTLGRNAKGPHKNDPGRSRTVYAPLADLFNLSNGCTADGRLRFGMAYAGGGVPRAYVESVRTGERYYLVLVWQEDWTANPFARSRFILGKLIYQKTIGLEAEGEAASGAAGGAACGGPFFARPYRITDNAIHVPDGAGLEEIVDAELPADRVKLGCDSCDL